MTNDQLIQYIIIAAYFVFILTKGIRHSKDIDNQEDFLLAGRNIGWFFLFATMSATVIGGGASTGAIGKTYEWGLLMVVVSLGLYMQFIFSGLFVAPRFREARVYTVAGYFGHRFDEKNRFVAFLLSLIFSIGVLGAQLVAFGKIITTMIPELPYLWAVLIGGGMVILYSTAGGLMAVIHTDVFQFVILFFGFLFTMILCAPDVMNEPNLMAKMPEDFFAIDGGKGALFLVTTFFAFLLGETFAPGYATRFVVGKSVKETKRGIVRAGIFLTVVFPILLFLIAMYARIHFPNIDPEQALPSTIVHLHNPYVGGLIIAALMSAVMSSADSILNSATAIFVKDLYEQYIAKGAPSSDSKRGLRLARYSSLALGAFGVTMALAVPNIIDLLLLTYNLWAPAIIVPVLAGALTKTRSRGLNNAVFVVSVVAIAATLAFMFGTPYADEVQPGVFGTFVAALAYFSWLVGERLFAKKPAV